MSAGCWHTIDAQLDCTFKVTKSTSRTCAITGGIHMYLSGAILGKDIFDQGICG